MRNDIRHTRATPSPQDGRSRLRALGLCGLGLALLLAAVFGCNGMPDYHTDTKPPELPSQLTGRDRWRITAGSEIRNAEKAIDDDRGTAAVSGSSYDKAYITIDLGKACVFNMVVIDHGRDEYGFCGRVGVLTSLDNQTYTPQRSEPGTRRVSILSLIRPTLARYVRIRADEQGGRPWSLAEIYLH